MEQAVARDDPDKKALAYYGALLPETADVWLRFLAGLPVSAVTTVVLAWCRQAAGARSKEVCGWIRAHNRQVKADGRGVRLLVCQLPIKSPWLNPIEPKWIHTKR